MPTEDDRAAALAIAAAFLTRPPDAPSPGRVRALAALGDVQARMRESKLTPRESLVRLGVALPTLAAPKDATGGECAPRNRNRGPPPDE